VNDKRNSLLLLILVCTVWTGAALYKYAHTRGPKKTTLHFVQYWQSEADKQFLAPFVEEFQSLYPSIEIIVSDRSYDELYQELPSFAEQLKKLPKKALRPDILAVDTRWLAAPGAPLESLDSYLQNGELATELMLEAPAFSGETAPERAAALPHYTVPLVSFIYTLFYNIEALQKAGFDRPPKTREEFFACCRSVGGGAFGMALAPDNPYGEEFFSWIYAGGLAFFDQGRPNRKTIEASLRFAEELAALGGGEQLAKSRTGRFNDFAAGHFTMMTGSIAEAGALLTAGSGPAFGITTVPPPASYTGRPRFIMRNWNLGIAAQSAHKDEAWLFISFLAGVETNAKLASAVSGIPANLSARGSIHGSGYYEKALAILETGEAVNELSAVKGGPALETLLRGALERQLTGGQAVEEAAGDIEEKWLAGETPGEDTP
jgi:multiple sugar transport system substrate-binding protein